MSADEKLVTAAQSGDVEAARAALDSGADKERKTGVRSLRITTQHCTALRARGHASCPTCRAQHGQTPLAWAAKEGHLGVVQLLVERGADFNTKDAVCCAAPAAAPRRAHPSRVHTPACSCGGAAAARRRGGVRCSARAHSFRFRTCLCMTPSRPRRAARAD
jgi:hypothetical protein